MTVNLKRGDKVRDATIAGLGHLAIKLAVAKGAEISMETNEHMVKVSIGDLGLSIPKSERHVVFKRFGRTEFVKKIKIPGTGLGCQAEIIQLHGI